MMHPGGEAQGLSRERCQPHLNFTEALPGWVQDDEWMSFWLYQINKTAGQRSISNSRADASGVGEDGS
jgi:hypothetical protein